MKNTKIQLFPILSKDIITIPTGVFQYPFEADLPENLPTSCEGKYGFIRYLASVNIIRPHQPIQTQTIAFTVIKPHNLNASPLFQVNIYPCLKDNLSFTIYGTNESYGVLTRIKCISTESNKKAAMFEIPATSVIVA